MSKLKKLLDAEVAKRNLYEELSYEKPDPLLVARRYSDEYVAFVCAMFAYGNAKQIVLFLDSLDFSLLEKSEGSIRVTVQKHYYRFQKSEDVIQFFITLKRLKSEASLEDFFLKGYEKNEDVVEGINSVIKKMHEVNSFSSHGYNFLVGSEVKKLKGASTLKRWMMFLRWMVRSDALDMGLWSRVDRAKLLMPLDTHTFNVSRRLGLLERKSYDLYAVVLLTQKLREFDESDPVKYDFALYRLGQEKLL